jgi:hypothetical protein
MVPVVLGSGHERTYIILYLMPPWDLDIEEWKRIYKIMQANYCGEICHQADSNRIDRLALSLSRGLQCAQDIIHH